VNQPVTADRCATPSDANWAGSNLWGQNAWDIYLQGGTLNGTTGGPNAWWEANGSPVYPTSSNDSQDIRWGCWPETGTQWIELDWAQPITTNGSSVYFLDDGGGVRLPASWVVQYWNGSAWVDVSNPSPSTYPIADNTFNGVSFDPVTTTKLRVSLASGLGSVGVIQ
jgi:hypothetical protein